MQTFMLGPADLTVADARQQERLALAARMRLIDAMAPPCPRDPRVTLGRVLVRIGARLLAMAPPTMQPAHTRIGGER